MQNLILQNFNMANDKDLQNGATWPMPKFRFEVDFGTGMAPVSFQEVSGLDMETQVIEYRKSNKPAFTTIKMPGIAKHGNITMKKGVFTDDNTFWNWYKQFSTNSVTRKTVTIKLPDEEGKTTIQWQLNNAWPIKITSTDLKANGNEVAVETIEIAHEGLTISNS